MTLAPCSPLLLDGIIQLIGRKIIKQSFQSHSYINVLHHFLQPEIYCCLNSVALEMKLTVQPPLHARHWTWIQAPPHPSDTR